MTSVAEKKPETPKKETKEKKAEPKDEMSEEDVKLKADLEMILERLEEPSEELYKAGLESLRDQIRTSTTSVTSVPKPLKFLRPHFPRLKAIHEKMKTPGLKALCADVVSALAMTMKGEREVLKYRLLGMQEDIASWGQEYVKHVSHELGEEWALIADDAALPEADKVAKRATLLGLAKSIVDFYLHHNSEVEACDLLMEIGEAQLVVQLADEATFARIGLYLTSCVPYLPDPENTLLLHTAKKLYERFGKELQALLCTVMLNDMDEIKRIFFAAKDPMTQRQMAIMLGRHQIFLDIPDKTPNADDLVALNSNSNLFQYFTLLARELDIMEPKHPEDIYKTHLEQTRPGLQSNVDSAKANLASTFVNGFVNTGFGQEKLMGEEPTKWFFKNKEYGMVSAAASVGLIYRWDMDSGLSKVDTNLYSPDNFIKAGSMMAIGIVSSGIYHECDPAQALLGDFTTSTHPEIMRIGAIFGLALAYTNSSRDSVLTEVIPKLTAVLADATASAEVQSLAGLAIGLIRVASGCPDMTKLITAALKAIDPEKLNSDTNYRFMALGVGLLHLGKQNKAEAVVVDMKTLPTPFGPMASTLVDVCAYAGTGNVLKIQELLHICSEHYEPLSKEEKEKAEKEKADKAKASAKGASSKATDGAATAAAAAKAASRGPDLSSQQAVAALGIGIIAMGEDIGSTMSTRVMGMLMRYGEAGIRRAVPLSLALTSVSNPQLGVLETLSKFSHDTDPETALCAIFGLGLVGAGTNNARLGNMLRQLAVFHSRDPQNLMMVRIAQGLTHLGKGTMTLNPYHMDRSLMCPASVAGILTTAFAFLDVKKTIAGPRQHYLLYSLVPAIQPRQLLTFVESSTPESSQLEQVNVSVRVGQAVDVVGQAGKPKGITGFQTQTTPVLLAHGERAELATDEYTAISPVLEGIVILKKNPDFHTPEEKNPKKKPEKK